MFVRKHIEPGQDNSRLPSRLDRSHLRKELLRPDGRGLIAPGARTRITKAN